MSDQHEEESLRRWAREQAEIERQTDALVLRTMTAMVTAAEDLKSKLRRETESIIEGYQRTKRGLENEISLSSAERQRFRREVEQERDAILNAARTEAEQIVQGAEREREQLLGEVRSMEQRLRTLEGQIRAVLGLDVAAATSGAAPAQAPTPSPIATTPRPPIRTLGTVPPTPAPSPTAAPPVVPVPVAPVAPVVVDAAEDDGEDDAPVTAAAAAPVFVPAPPPPVVSEPEPASLVDAAPEPEEALATHLRPVELVFDGVPGYQQASALERAVNDLLPDEDVDIVEFERGQLVLSVQATDLEALARDLVAASPASLELDAVSGDRATFRCV